MLPVLEKLADLLRENGYIVHKVVRPPTGLPDIAAYQPYANGWAVYSPWVTDPLIQTLVGELLARGANSLVSPDRLWNLKAALQQTRDLAGEVWELGVYKGGSALLLRRLLEQTLEGQDGTIRLRLFDTFDGMPVTDKEKDFHNRGDFSDTSLQAVKQLVGEQPWVEFRQGVIPGTFKGLDSSTIRFAHVDLDIYESIRAACAFVYPRLVPGGLIVFDDYGFWSCPGARQAVDEFFADKPVAPFVLPTGQALVAKLPGSGAAAAGRNRRQLRA